MIARSYARKYSLLPVAQIGRSLTVAMDDPTASAVVEELARLTNHTITIVTASSKAIQQSMRRLYEAEIDPPEVVAAPSAKSHPPDPARAALESHAGRRVDDPLHQIIALALDLGASDIHLEAGRHSIRFRIDGHLREADSAAMPRTQEKSLRELPARLRTLAGLDAGDRVPQHGGFQIVDTRTRAPIGVRVSILPSAAGDSVVIRIADRARAPKSIADLHLSQAVTARLEKALVQKGGGLFLVTGPAGSGRSTTLAACVAVLNRPDVRILVVDEPGELAAAEVSRFDVRDEPGQTYADFLRVVLRHDPDVVMIGEIADRETADLACRAAESGRLVLSTLHTGTAVAAVPRLLGLGVDPGLLAPVLRGVMSQRLIRKTAARGRTPIAEFWTPDDEDRRLILSRAPFDDLRRSAARHTHKDAG